MTASLTCDLIAPLVLLELQANLTQTETPNWAHTHIYTHRETFIIAECVFTPIRN